MASSSGSFSADFQGLAQLPGMISEVKMGIGALKSLVSTPAAAAATGSPVAGAAIGGLGVALVAFIAQTIDALSDDIKAITKNNHAYQQVDQSVTQAATAGLATVNAHQAAPAPALGRGEAVISVPSGSTSVVSGHRDAVAVA